jgi:diazepam-binding inhibitor (GABA receptor modulator, acyl-CoA-binding protein)
MATDNEFDAAVEDVKTLPTDPGNDAKLRLYALYKQATEGDVEGRRPGFTNPFGRAKYDAWLSVSGMSRDEARTAYVELVRSLGA